MKNLIKILNILFIVLVLFNSSTIHTKTIIIETNDKEQVKLDLELAKYSITMQMLLCHLPEEQHVLKIKGLDHEQIGIFATYIKLLQEQKINTTEEKQRYEQAKCIGTALAGTMDKISLENWAQTYETFNYLNVPELLEALLIILPRKLKEYIHDIYDYSDNFQTIQDMTHRIDLVHENQMVNTLMQENKPMFLAPFERRATFSGHENCIYAVEISADGKTIASGSWDNSIRILNGETGNQIKAFPELEIPMSCLAISADGKILVAGSSDKTVKIWNVETGTTKTLGQHPNTVNAVAISHDGTTIVSASKDGTINIWNRHTGTLINTFQGHEGPILSIAINHDGTTFVSGGWDKTVKIWDGQTGTAKTLGEHHDSVNCVAISVDGTTIVSGSKDGTIKIWNRHTEDIIKTIQGHEGSVFSVAINHDGTTFVSGGWDKTVKIWDRQTGDIIKPIQEHEGQVFSVGLNYDGTTIVSGSQDKTVKIWKRDFISKFKKNGLSLMQALVVIMLDTFKPKALPAFMPEVFKDSTDNDSEELLNYLRKNYRVAI